MNGFVHFDHPPPKSWDQFEELCADTLQEEWQDPTLVRNGRAGQAQHGVDIVGQCGAVWPVGIQCKRKTNWPVSKLSLVELDCEIEKAKSFRPQLKAYYLISTAPDDQLLQEHAREVTAIHRLTGLFDVAVIGWSELLRRATRHPKVAAKHFGPYSTESASPLLVSWQAKKSKLIISERELKVAIREGIQDLYDFPSGRIVVRQRETENLIFKIRKAQSRRPQSYRGRKEIINLRDKLTILQLRESAVAKGLNILLGHPYMRETIRSADDDQAAMLVRSFVEQELDPNLAIVTGLEKIRLHPPGAQNDEYVALFIPVTEINAIHRRRRDLKTSYPDLNTDILGELPPYVKFTFAIPAVIRWIVQRLADGYSIQKMESLQWFEMYLWKFEY